MLLVGINDDRPTYNLHLLYMYSMFFSMGVAELLVVVLHLYCPNGISPMGNLGCFPWGKPAVTIMLPNLRCMLGTKGILKCAQILMHAVAHDVCVCVCARVCVCVCVWTR